MNGIEIFRLLEIVYYVPNNAMQFLRNYSGHFARLTCNHSYGYAHCLIFMGPIELVTH